MRAVKKTEQGHVLEQARCEGKLVLWTGLGEGLSVEGPLSWLTIGKEQPASIQKEQSRQKDWLVYPPGPACTCEEQKDVNAKAEGL